ncbi:MAG: hypothetical protein ACJAVS_000273 [Paracoccaceae bacterium]|jgi:hypothetical protein
MAFSQSSIFAGRDAAMFMPKAIKLGASEVFPASPLVL